MKTIRLRVAKERSLLRRHPWVFESSIERGKADPGETVRVEAHDGRFLAWAAFSPASKIRLRAWSFDEAERIDAAFMQRRVARAVALRERLAVPSDGVRLVHGEADGLPGLVVDRYADTLSVQFLSAGAERWKAALADALLKSSGAARLYERSDTSSRALEGLEPCTGWLRGEGATEVTIREHGWQLTLDVAARPQDRLLPRPARQPPALRRGGAPLRLPARAELLCLHRRVQRRRAGRRRRPRDERRFLGAGIGTRRRACRAERLRREPARERRCRRQPHPARGARGRSPLRRDRARPAEVRGQRGARRAGRARLQGHQPAGLRSCSSRAGCCSPSRARAASRSTCSTRSSPAQASMPASTA